MIRAISAYIHKHDFEIGGRVNDCSNGGISSRYDKVYIEHPRGPLTFDENNLPENFVKVCPSRVDGYPPHLEPVNGKIQGYVGWMYGGAIIDSSDGRFRDISKCPLHLHDRQESQRVYDMLSR